MHTFRTTVSAIVCALLLSGCMAGMESGSPRDVGDDLTDRLATAQGLAASAGLESAVIDGGAFQLQTYARGFGEAITVYLEGDGFAWASQTRPSSDPTPHDPVGLRLAAVDPSPAVAYIARPCQYVRSHGCASRLWTSHRFSDEVVTAMDAALSTLKMEAGASRVHLVGFSGGAAVAALIAARRSDVASLRTVAGYLDPVALNRERGVDPLTGSLDPMRAAPSLSRLPQLHFQAARDTVIPSWVGDGFIAAQGPESCARVLGVNGASHTQGWAERWPSLLAHPLSC